VYSFGSIRVDGVTYDHDLIIDRGKIRKRKKAASKRFRGVYGHTPLSAAEDIPDQDGQALAGQPARLGYIPGGKQPGQFRAADWRPAPVRVIRRLRYRWLA
jgi:hypothetical protein